MKNLAHLILALIAAQLLVAGIARAAVTSPSVDQQSHVCAMPDGDGSGDDGTGGPF
jgi:hypothetical protein